MRHSRPTAWLPALLLLAASAAPALAREVVLRDESSAFPLEGARLLRLDLGVGDLQVDVAAGDRVEVRLKATCGEHKRRCRERAERLSLAPTRHGDDLRLRLSGQDDDKGGVNYPEVELQLVVPPALALVIDMGVGEVDLSGVEGDITIDLGVGDVHVAVPEQAVRSVGIDVGIGDARLSPRQEGAHRSGFLNLGNEVDWQEGRGQARLTIDVGVGDAQVRLLP